MKIIIAPDKFKGSLSGIQAAQAIKKGIHRFDASIQTYEHPLADGGDGTLDVLANFFHLQPVDVLVHDPLFRTINARYFHNHDTAYIEMANASGLLLLKPFERDCYNSSTLGTGELIADAIHKGYKKIILFIGGSATNDAGIGMAAALGYRFYNNEGTQVKPTGKNLIEIQTIDNSSSLLLSNKIDFTVICDVKNPLYGSHGAAFVYAAQKGASLVEIEALDSGLKHFSQIIKENLDVEVANIPGAGAAGGLGAGALAFLQAKMQSGIDFVLKETKFLSLLSQEIDLIITGEGAVDKQTIQGKVIKGVSDMAKMNNVPFSILAGVVYDEKIIQENLQPFALKSIMNVASNTDDAMQNAAMYLEKLSFDLVRDFYKHCHK